MGAVGKNLNSRDDRISFSPIKSGHRQKNAFAGTPAQQINFVFYVISITKIILLSELSPLLCSNIYILPNNTRSMKSMFLPGTTSGLFFFAFSFLSAQGIDGACGTPAPASDSAEKPAEKQFWLWRGAQVTGGQLTLPFKIRRRQEHNTFRLTTDVTLGGYIGYTRRLSEKRDFYLSVPLTAGLTFININDNNTTLDLTASDTEVVPGLSWSMGVVFQMDKYNIGLLFGKDYASEVGDQWEYHGKLWWSFGVGFVFLQ